MINNEASVTKLNYAVLRVGKRYHANELHEIKEAYQVHMNREKDIENADKELSQYNEVIIGTKDMDIQKEIETFIADAWKKKDSVLCTDIMLTATGSASYFKDNLEKLNRWVILNTKYLKERFKDMCRYAVVHKDEVGSYHIHALIAAKMTNEKGKVILNNKSLFGGKYRLTNWQNDYSSYMQQEFKDLSRGIKGTGKYRASFSQIKNWYAYMNKELDENDIESIKVKAKQADILQHRVNVLEHLAKQKDYIQEEIIEKNKTLKVQKEVLYKAYTELKKNNEAYKKVLHEVSHEYNISGAEIKDIMKSIDKKEIKKDKGKER